MCHRCLAGVSPFLCSAYCRSTIRTWTSNSGRNPWRLIVICIFSSLPQAADLSTHLSTKLYDQTNHGIRHYPPIPPSSSPALLFVLSDNTFAFFLGHCLSYFRSRFTPLFSIPSLFFRTPTELPSIDLKSQIRRPHSDRNVIYPAVFFPISTTI